MHSDFPPLSHSRVEVLSAAGLPIILIIGSDGFQFEHWDRFRNDHYLGISSQKSYARSIGLFIDFLAAHSERFLKKEERHLIFSSFAEMLITGSIKDGNDADQLWWSPKSIANSKRILREVITFTNWLANEAGTQPVIPTRKATLAEQITFWHAWNYRKDNSLLSYLQTRFREQASSLVTSTVGIRKTKSTTYGDIKAFSEHLLADLIHIGFKRNRQRRWTTLRDQMITLLMHGGGLRLSETLHLWIPDVLVDPEASDSAVVHIFHPSDGAIWFRDPESGKQKKTTRIHYLRLFHDRAPLTNLAGNKRVGWKDLLLNDKNEMYARVFWRSKEYSTAFMRLFREYMRIRPLVTSHPYLFIVPNKEPMTIKAFEKVHAVAIRRIGLEPAKNHGTTPHAHRHAYGKWLHKNKIDPKVIQIAMHHKGIASQEVYKELTIAEVCSAIDDITRDRNEVLRFDSIEGVAD